MILQSLAPVFVGFQWPINFIWLAMKKLYWWIQPQPYQVVGEPSALPAAGFMTILQD